MFLSCRNQSADLLCKLIYKCPKKQVEQNFGSLFVRINKSVGNTALTEWFSFRSIETVESSIRVVELAGHILDSVRYCHKRAHLIHIFRSTHQKRMFKIRMAHFSLILQWALSNNWTLISSKIGAGWLSLFSSHT